MSPGAAFLPSGVVKTKVNIHLTNLVSRVENCPTIGNCRHNHARRGSPRLDLSRAPQENHRYGQIHQRVHGGVHKGEDHQEFQLGFDQFPVGLAEAQLFVNLPYAGFHNPDTGDVLLKNAVYFIKLLLQTAEQRICTPNTDNQTGQHKGQDIQHDISKGPVQPVHTDDAAEGQHGGADQAADKLTD